MIRIIQTILNEFLNWRGDASGNVAVIFAIATIPIVTALGAAVDYARMARTFGVMQDAADAASLALSRQPSVSTMSSVQLQQYATTYFSANFHDEDVSRVSVQAAYQPSGPSVQVTANVTMPLNFGAFLGASTVDLKAAATTVWGQTRLRVALVLDNTGSMSDGGKMNALKTASHNLLDQLRSSTRVDGDAYVSIIPFAKDVNVDDANYRESWVRWDLFDEVNGSCSKSKYKTKSACVSARKTWSAANHKTWNGCVTDRDQDYDVLNSAPNSARSSTLFPAEQYDSCPASLTALSYDWRTLGRSIDAMTPAGGTNQAIGLQWGWQSLTAAPFAIPAYDPRYEYRQVIILLTDGLNTQDRWYGDGTDYERRVDDRQAELCRNIKAAGIVLYTVQVNTGRDPKSQLLENCASSPDNYFLLTSADQIVTTFDTIGTALSDLRLAS